MMMEGADRKASRAHSDHSEREGEWQGVGRRRIQELSKWRGGMIPGFFFMGTIAQLVRVLSSSLSRERERKRACLREKEAAFLGSFFSLRVRLLPRSLPIISLPAPGL
jgi:hypothetical protein